MRFFDSLLTAPRTVSNMYAPVARVQLRANHVQHIGRLSCATCRVVVSKNRSAIKFDRVEIALNFSFISLAETISGGNRSRQRKITTTSFRKRHILKLEMLCSTLVFNPHSSIGGRCLLEKHELTITSLFITIVSEVLFHSVGVYCSCKQ